MYHNVTYVKFNNTNIGINAEIGGIYCFIPLDSANTDYQNIMKLVKEGKLIIQPAEDINNQGQ